MEIDESLIQLLNPNADGFVTIVCSDIRAEVVPLLDLLSDAAARCPPKKDSGCIWYLKLDERRVQGFMTTEITESTLTMTDFFVFIHILSGMANSFSI